MPEVPILRYSCKHEGSKKVVNREYLGGGIVTSVDLCKECVNDPVFSEKSDYKDTKISKQPKNKPLTTTQLKKAIKKRQDEIQEFDKQIKDIWHESDKIDRIGKLLERYTEICQLYEDLERLNESYLEKIQKQ